MPRADLRLPVLLAAIAFVAASARASAPFAAWANGTISMRLQLDASGAPSLPAGGISDGSSNWSNAVIPALAAWNAHMNRTKFTHTISASTAASRGDSVNNVTFSSTIYGTAFPTRVLAVTVGLTTGQRSVRLVESDVIFNTAESWDSYRGALRSRMDIHRVAMHEFGHVIGLDHPDEETPPQSVAALMNAVISNIESLQPDDIGGADVLYSTTLVAPVISTQPQNRTVAVGSFAEMAIRLNGADPPPSSPILQYSWFFTPAGGSEEFLFTIDEGMIPLGAAQLSDRGQYRVIVETPQGEAQSAVATLDVTPVALAPATRLANISSRGHAGIGSQTLIVGFVVGDGEPRRVLIRGVGPTLANPPHNVTGAVLDPQITLHGEGGQIATNQDWGDGGSAVVAEMQATFVEAGAFPLPVGSADAALIATLPRGEYTALLSPANGVPGVAIVEVYDLDLASPTDGRLVNLSTRAFVGTGDSILIGGFVIHGSGPRRYVLRAVGDSLGSFDVPDFLDDTVLTLFDSTGRRLRWVDDWDSPEFLQPELTAAFTAVGAFPFVDRQESAMRVVLNPGAYTLQVRGFDGLTGVALVELYEEE